MCLLHVSSLRKQKLLSYISRGEKVLILIYFADVFQTDDKINSEPKIKKLEPVLLPGKHQSFNRYFRNVFWSKIILPTSTMWLTSPLYLR